MGSSVDRRLERPSPKKARILAAAAHVFAANGFHTATVDDIEPAFFAAGFLGMLGGISSEALLTRRLTTPDAVRDYARKVVHVVLYGVADNPGCDGCIHFDGGTCKIYQRERVASRPTSRDDEAF